MDGGEEEWRLRQGYCARGQDGCLTAWLTRGVDDDYRDAQIEAGAVAGAKAEGAAEASADADAAVLLCCCCC